MEHKFIPFKQKELTEKEQLVNSEIFYQLLNERRSVREFSDKPVSSEVIENIIRL